MNNFCYKKSLIIFLIILPFQITFASSTIILQNGLNGYEGCDDAHIWQGYKSHAIDSQNFGDKERLVVYYGNDNEHYYNRNNFR